MLAERQSQLDQLLPLFHALWHPQPFREIRPQWCVQWPDLATQLLVLNDADTARLNADSSAALAFLARYVPGVAELDDLAALPQLERQPLSQQATAWAWEIPGRKQQQIEAFSGACQCGGHSVLDWCGGKGHLGRLLGLQWAVPVQTLEIDPVLCADGLGLANRQRLHHEFLVSDALTVADWPKSGQHAVALHACGELHRRLITQGAHAGVARFDVAPCCYYRGVAECYQPMSGVLRTVLTRDDLRLAVTETITASSRLTRQRDKEMAWKLAFDTYQRSVTSGEYKSFKPVPAGWFRLDFAEFLTRMVEREGLPTDNSVSLARFELIGEQRQRDVMRLSIVRHAFRRALEVWLNLDLAVYLENHGYTVSLGSFCERQLTPRNLLISARCG